MGDDITLLHAAAIRSGLPTVLLPYRALVVVNAQKEELAFARGVAPSTDQGAAAFLEERDIVRTYLASKGIPVPRSSVHTFQSRDDDLRRSLSALGGTVSVRPAWQSRRLYRCGSISELQQAVKKLQGAAGRNASRIGRPQSRYILEEDTEPIADPVLIAHGQTLTPSSIGGEDAAETGRLAVESIPGIHVAAVRLARRDSDGGVVVTSLSPVPRFEEWDCNASMLARQTIYRELEYHGWELSLEKEGVQRVTVEVSGVPQSKVFQNEFVRFLSEHSEFSGDAWVNEQKSLVGTVQGDSQNLAITADRLIRGSIDNTYPLRVDVRPE